MDVKDLRDYLDDIPDDTPIVLSKPFIIDEKDDITAILDIPICGIALKDVEDDQVLELRFLISLNDAKSVFSPDEILWEDK